MTLPGGVRVRRRGGRRREGGFALVGAVFVIVVLAAAAAMLATMVGAQNRAASLSLLHARAYHAARSGVEWGVRSALTGGACPPASTLSLTEGGLAGFDVQVQCTASVHAEAGRNVDVYRIEAEAWRGSLGQPEFVRRRVVATAVDAP